MSQEWDWQSLLADALKAGIAVSEFWAMTPRETAMMMEAATWRHRQEQQRNAWLAWHVAALIRSHRMPSLQQLRGETGTRMLAPEEAARRRREQEEMAARVDQVRGRRHGG